MFYQETLSVDGIIDRMFTKAGRASNVTEQIDKTLQQVLQQKVPLEYIEDRVTNKYKKWQTQLESLKKIGIIEQRTPEWYASRKSMITASDFAQALGEGKFGTQRQFFQKKCGYEEEKFDPCIPPLKWGTMFEPLATTIYSMRNNVHVYEFGLLRHPTVSYFGASPDGINSLGIMLEIKCPFKRKINGTVPTQYYYQIQGQLDVCDLDECDYLECEFSTYMEEHDFLSDVESPNETGIIFEQFDGENFKYMYSDIIACNTSYEDKKAILDSFQAKCNASTKNMENCCYRFWRLDVLNIVRVYRDKQFVAEKLKALGEVWDKLRLYGNDEKLYIDEVGKVRKVKVREPILQGYSFIDE